MKDIKLQLGDIVRVYAPTDSALHEQTFYVYYYDPTSLIELVHVSNMSRHDISLKDGILLETKIEKITVLNRSIHKGFARQNNLIQGSWIELMFDSTFQVIITGMITHLEEDMIQITTYPEQQVLYIDFAYKGIPKHIPLKSICFRNKPASYRPEEGESSESKDEYRDDDVTSHFNELGEEETDMPKELRMEESYSESLKEDYLRELSVTPTPEVYKNSIDLAPHVITYDVDVQMNELLDDLIFKLPDDKRSSRKMKEIYTHVNRFKELRELYSTFDEYHQVSGYIRHENPRAFKPLVDDLYDMTERIPWIVPVATIVRRLYSESDKLESYEDFHPYNDCTILRIEAQVQSEYEMMNSLFSQNETPSVDNIKYANANYQLSQEHYTPYLTLGNQGSIHDPIASDIDILHDHDMVLSHDNEFISTFMPYPGSALRKKYITQRFTGPIHYNHYMGRNTNEMRELMPSDKASIHSMLVMPYHYVSQSGYNHKASSVLEKTKYYLPPLSQILKKCPIKQKEVKLQSDDNQVFPKENFITHVTLEPTETPLVSNVLKYPNFKAYLQSFVPSTLDLIKHDYFYAQNSNSFNRSQYLKIFYPYGLYDNTITFSVNNQIHKHIRDNLSKYNGDYLEKRDEYSNYAVEKYAIPPVENPMFSNFMDTYFLESRRIQVEISNKYHFTLPYQGYMPTLQKVNLHGSLIGSEPFYKISLMDDSRYLSLWLLSMNTVLISPQIMIEPYVEPKHFYDANQKAISKKYKSIREMQEDNNVRDLKYDKEYDANQYDVLLKYRKERSRMTPEAFLEFLSQKLAEEYGCSLENTQRLAEELIQGYKIVNDDDYALLEMVPELPPGVEECTFTDKEKEEIKIEASVRKVQKYFKRINHNWIYDPDVDSSSFAKPKELTCALKDDAEVIGKGINKEKIFANQYGTQMDIIEEKIKKKIEIVKKQSQLLYDVKELRKVEVDKYQTKIGNLAYISETLPSPHKENLDNINHRSIDFKVKQEFIVTFRIMNCRDALPHENQHWLYCKESESVPLLPLSQYDLALAFQEGKYKTVLQQIIKEKGKVCDGFYVDKYCGNTLDAIDYSEQGTELYTEIEEQDTWEPEDMNDTYEIDEHSQKRLYKNSKMRHVYNIVSAICKNLFVPVHTIEDTVMSLCMDFMGNKSILFTKEKHERNEEAREKAKKNDYKKISYETYYQSTLLDIVTCSLIVSIQTIVPSFVPRRTYGDCIKQLDGYPLMEDSGNMGTIEYISCILKKMQQDKKTMPWKTISKKKGAMEERLKRMFTKYLVNESRIQDLLKEKRIYLENHQEENIPSQLQMQNTWQRFLPPLRDIVIIDGKSPLRNIASPVHDEFKKALKSGDVGQWRLMGMYFCKTLSFSFGTLQAINNIVKDKANLLGKHANYTILENACCYELNKSHIPMKYFQQLDESVTSYLNNIHSIGSTLQKMHQVAKPAMLHAEIKQPIVQDENKLSVFCRYSENIMYKTFIKYCNLDFETKPIPSFMETFLTEKPEEYDVNGSIEEKIAYLKTQGKTMTLSTFSSMMTQVNRHNTVRLPTRIDLSYQEKVMNHLEGWKECMKSDSVFECMCNNFQKYVNREDIGSLEEENSQEETFTPEQLKTKLLDELENTLQIHINDMKKDLARCMDESLGYHPSVIAKLLKSFEDWDENLSYVSFGQFVKNYLYYICCIVPNYINDGTKILHNTKNMKKLLMEEDQLKIKDVIDEKYIDLQIFKSDKYLVPFMQEIKKCLKPMYDFLTQFYGFFPTDRTKLYGRFFLFSLIFIFHYLVQVSIKDETTSIVFQGIREEEDQDDYDLGDYVEEMQIADQHQVQSRLFKFIQTLLETRNSFNRDKQTTLFTYEKIRKNVERVEADEKKKMMDRFKNIKDIKTRRAELLLKKYHLGKFFVDPKVIKTYGKRRDEMLNTDDSTEDNFLFGTDEITEDDVQDLIEEMNENLYNDTTAQEEIDWGDSDEEEATFLPHVEDDDANDIAENAYDNL